MSPFCKSVLNEKLLVDSCTSMYEMHVAMYKYKVLVHLCIHIAVVLRNLFTLFNLL